jgi:hypothetical protein
LGTPRKEIRLKGRGGGRRKGGDPIVELGTLKWIAPPRIHQGRPDRFLDLVASNLGGDRGEGNGEGGGERGFPGQSIRPIVQGDARMARDPINPDFYLGTTETFLEFGDAGDGLPIEIVRASVPRESSIDGRLRITENGADRDGGVVGEGEFQGLLDPDELGRIVGAEATQLGAVVHLSLRSGGVEANGSSTSAGASGVS